MAVGGQRHAPGAFLRNGEWLRIIREAGWAPGPVWTKAENLAYIGILSLNLPARNDSLQSSEKSVTDEICKMLTFIALYFTRELSYRSN
jgi:hypothetical protein